MAHNNLVLAVGLCLGLLAGVLRMVRLKRALAATGSAIAVAIRSNARVLMRERMAVLAFQFLSRRAASVILLISDRLKMIRVHARVYAAEMIKLKSFRDCAYGKLIGPSMGQDSPALPIGKATIPPKTMGSPEPTRISKLHLCPEPFGWSPAQPLIAGARQWIGVSLPTLIMNLAPATGMTRGVTVRDVTLRLHRKLSPFGVMRRGVTSALAAFIVAGLGMVAIASAGAGGVNGDVTCGGEVNSIDALRILQYDAGIGPDPRCLENADVDGSGHIDPIDAALILQYDAGFIEALP